MFYFPQSVSPHFTPSSLCLLILEFVENISQQVHFCVIELKWLELGGENNVEVESLAGTGDLFKLELSSVIHNLYVSSI